MAAAYVIILPSPDRLVSADNLRCCSDRTNDDYADRAVALNVGDRRFVDARIERGPRRVELIVTGSAKDVRVFRRVDARESLPHHAPEKSAVATPNSEVGKFICVRAIMTRNILDEAHIHPAIRKTITNHHADTVSEVRAAVAANDVVVVGMKQNPFPRKARKALDAAGIAYKYLTFGSYLGGWQRRGALRMWTGWPTFPMVFVKGVLVGGADDLKRLIESGELTRMLSGKPGPRRKK